MLADRPEHEVIGSENLQNGLHHHHMRMMPDPLIRRHGLSAAAGDLEQDRYLRSPAVSST
ncbi:hypothetical protein ACFW84_03260 [Streptomyces anulatus]|uniref:hypothetical protein n=1 Tax=Streptomyces anulatus TaxID=1892 RepID=UPI0036B5A29C